MSVHSIVSTDFAVTMLPGWHSTIFPPFFVAGAIFSGFAMVVTLLVPARRLYRLENVVTTKHLDNIGKMLLVTGWIVAYSYVFEIWTAYRGEDPFEKVTFLVERPFGPYAVSFWAVILCNCVVPQVLWSKRIRTGPVSLWIVAHFITRPLHDVASAIIKTSKGDYDTPIDDSLDAQDEVSHVWQALAVLKARAQEAERLAAAKAEAEHREEMKLREILLD